MQTTHRVFMVRPVLFGFNEETAANNAFQVRSETDEAVQMVERQAVREFDDYVALLRENGVTVEVLQDVAEPATPDSIFPNNCFSVHDTGTEKVLVLYPMFAKNRRLERSKLMAFLDKLHFDSILDLTDNEERGLFLEGTGSLILDREHRFAYACQSPRTHREVVSEWAERMNYDYFMFDSQDEKGVPVYHSNVMMHVGTRFAIVCLDSIRNIHQREQLIRLLEERGKEIVAISLEQMHRFAGNMLELTNHQGEKLLVMSKTAKDSLTPEQIGILEEDVRILAPDISVIEKAGGGSARCMLAELY